MSGFSLLTRKKTCDTIVAVICVNQKEDVMPADEEEELDFQGAALGFYLDETRERFEEVMEKIKALPDGSALKRRALVHMRYAGDHLRIVNIALRFAAGENGTTCRARRSTNSEAPPYTSFKEFP